MKVESKVPKLRFRGFTGSWKSIALENVADNKTKWSFTGGPFGSDLTTKDYTDEGVRILQLQNIGDSTFYNGYKIYTSKQKADELISANIFPHEILIAKMGDPVARACVVPALEDRYLMASDGIRLVPNNKFFETKYVFHYLCTSKFRKKALSLSTGSTRKRIGLTDLRKIKINVPSLQEQQKIATFLSSVDTKIELLQKKKEKLEEYKKGMMQKIFSQEIRFKDETGSNYPEWIKGQLGDIGEVSMCRRIYKNETSVSGDIPFYKIGTFGGIPDAYINSGLFEKYKNMYPFPKPGEILISASGTIGRKVVYDGKPAYFQDSNIIWLSNKENLVVNKFLYYLYDNIIWRTDTTTISRLYNSVFNKVKISYPVKEEQQKISSFLSSIGKKIELVENQLTQTQQFKKALLQQMFV